MTGLGIVAAEHVEEALAGKHSAPPDPTPEITAFEVPEGAPAWGFEALNCSFEKELPNVKSFIDRTSGLALVGAKYALADAGLLERDVRPAGTEIGCAFGSAMGCLEAMSLFWNKVKTSNPKFAQPLVFTHGYANSPSSLMCIEYGLRGASATFSGERLAGVEALMFAFDQIGSGSAEVILAGASESLAAPVFNHLNATGELSRTGKWDDGIVPGEGAVMLVLESRDFALQRKARIYAEIEGINFFPLDPRSTVSPIQFATEKRETLVFVSTPNIGPKGGWPHPLISAEMTAATKYYSGDMLSVSPLLGAALGAGVLGGRYGFAAPPNSRVLPTVAAAANSTAIQFAVATGYEPSGTLGVVFMKKA